MKLPIKEVQTKKGPKWQLRLDTKVAGRRSQPRRRYDTEVEALQAYIEHLAPEVKKEAEANAVVLGPTFTMEYDNWLLKRARVEFSTSWLRTVEGIYANKLADTIGAQHISTFTKSSLIDVREKIREENCRSEDSKLTNKSVNNQFGVVKAVLSFAHRLDRIPTNPAAGIPRLKTDEPDITFLDFEEVASFLKFASQRHPPGSPTRWVYRAYLFAINTGARAGEVWGAALPALRPAGKMIVIDQQFDRVSGEIAKTKTGVSRNVPYPDLLAAEMRFHIQENGLKGEALLFKMDGRPVNHDLFVQRFLEPDVKAWGGKGIWFHVFRHTFATLMLASGVSIKEVQSMMGHASILTTQRYLHLLKNFVKGVSEKTFFAPLEEGGHLSLVSND